MEALHHRARFSQREPGASGVLESQRPIACFGPRRNDALTPVEEPVRRLERRRIQRAGLSAGRATGSTGGPARVNECARLGPRWRGLVDGSATGISWTALLLLRCRARGGDR